MGSRRKNRRPQPEPVHGSWLDSLTDTLTIRAAGDHTSALVASVADPFPVGSTIRLSAEGEPVELKAEDGGEPPADGKPRLRKFSGVVYTGGAMSVGFGMPVVVDLEGLSVPRQNNPALKGHDTDQIVGHTEKVEVTAQRLKASGVVSNVGDAADEVRARADEGFPWQMSMGASIQQREYVDAGKTVQVNGKNFAGPLMVARKTTLGEVSFVPIGADQSTSAAIAAQQHRETDVNFDTWLKARGFDPAKLSDPEKTLLRAAFDAEQKITAAPPPAPPVAQAPVVDFGAELQRQLQAGRDALAAEATRVGEIEIRCARFDVVEVEVPGADGKPVKVNLKAHAIKEGWTPDQVELHARRAERPVVPGGHVYATGRPEITEQVLEAALLHASRHDFHLEDDGFYCDQFQGHTVRRVPERIQRETQRELQARYTDQVQQSAHSIFRGQITPKQFLIAAFAANGIRADLDLSGEVGVKAALARWDHLEKERMIRAEGASNLSISNVLANVLGKFALQGYLFVEQAWRKFTYVKSVVDFKAIKSINLLGDVMFKQIGSSGELQNASLGDQAFSNQANPFGRILTLPYTHLVNDDLGMLTGAPRKIGQGAGLALNDNLWTLIKNLIGGSVNGDDGVSFFRTTTSTTAGKAYKANKITGGSSALSSTSLTTMRALYDNQVDPNNNPLGFDGAMPILLHGPTNWRAARELATAGALVYGGGSAALQPNVNVWEGQFEPVMSRYMEAANYVNSATAWLMFYAPEAVPAIEAVFLNGVDTPSVIQAGPDYQFDRLGISIRGTMPFGTNQQNFRGAYYAAGT